MDIKRAYALIDESSLDSCRTLMAISAPDLYDELSSLIRSMSDPDELLTSARDLVKQAYLREDK